MYQPTGVEFSEPLCLLCAATIEGLGGTRDFELMGSLEDL
jgi:hypothetical protein